MARKPKKDLKMKVSKKKALNMVLASIALEEKSLARLVEVEAKKLHGVVKQYKEKEADFADLLLANRSVDKTLRNVIKNQMLLQHKLEDVSEMYQRESFEDDDDK